MDAGELGAGDELEYAPAAFAAELDEVHVDAGEGGRVASAMISQLSKPTSDTRPGRRCPISRSASATPRAI